MSPVNTGTSRRAGAVRTLLIGALLVCAAIVIGLLLIQGGGTDPASAPTPSTAQTGAPEPTGLLPTATTTTPASTITPPTRPPTQAPTSGPGATHTPVSGLPWIAESDLPPQAWETLRLIEAGGPYPYRQDDSTFFNREGILPSQRRGYYREYTVQTPRSRDRGARRIVAGADGDLYYTDDHYDSFAQIAQDQ